MTTSKGAYRLVSSRATGWWWKVLVGRLPARRGYFLRLGPWTWVTYRAVQRTDTEASS